MILNTIDDLPIQQLTKAQKKQHHLLYYPVHEELYHEVAQLIRLIIILVLLFLHARIVP
jgi:hypothetical protein